MEYKVARLKEITKYISRGITPKYTEELNGICVVNQKCIRDYKLLLENSRLHDINKKGITSEKIIQKYDILINSTGVGTAGRVAQNFEDKPFTADSHVTIVRPNSNKIDPCYLGYALKKQQKFIEGLAEGSTGQTEISRQRIGEEILIKYPTDFKIQKKIANILLNIDQKIELNNKINDNLLELIKTLYIEKIKNNNEATFEYKTLDEFCNIFTGKKNANASEDNGKYKFFTCAPEPLNINTYIYDGPAVIVAGNGAYTGRTNFYNGKFDLYQRTYGITTNNDYIYLFYAMIYTDLQNDIMGGTHGSAIPYIVMNDIAKFKVKYNKEIFDELSEKIKSLLLKIKSNELENETLINLRDSLLPKLMNGEIDLDKIEI